MLSSVRISQTAIYIAILVGQSGCGKGKFLNCLVQEEAWKADRHGQFKDNPMHCIALKVPRHDGRFILVDVPESNPHATAEDTFDQAIWWVHEKYKVNATNVGVIFYFHDITTELPLLPNLRYRQCSDAQLVFVTTHWDKIDHLKGEAREAELRGNFAEMFMEGSARMIRFDNKTTTALGIIDSVLWRKRCEKYKDHLADGDDEIASVSDPVC